MGLFLSLLLVIGNVGEVSELSKDQEVMAGDSRM